MNILYITGIDISIKSQTGILKKVLGQSKALFDINNNVYLIYTNKNKLIIRDVRNNLIETIEFSKSKNNISRLKKYSFISQWCNTNNINSVYIRFDGIDPITLFYLRLMKKEGLKIVLELPTYPFDSEVKGRIKKHLNQSKYAKAAISMLYRSISNISYNFAYKIIDKIVTYMPYERIWNISVIEIDNGIDSETVLVKQSKLKNEVPIFICVANVSKWHGLDRIIEGLELFKHKNNKIPSLWVVGEGSEISYLKNIVKEKSLEEYVIFFGNKVDSELDDLIDQADIGIGSLGMHRIGLSNGSTLKTKEYFARGLPFIYAYNEKLIADDCKYALKFPQNDEPININECIGFFNRLEETSNIQTSMRTFAEEKYDWNIQMKAILNYLNGVTDE